MKNWKQTQKIPWSAKIICNLKGEQKEWVCENERKNDRQRLKRRRQSGFQENKNKKVRIPTELCWIGNISVYAFILD